MKNSLGKYENKIEKLKFLLIILNPASPQMMDFSPKVI